MTSSSASRCSRYTSSTIQMKSYELYWDRRTGTPTKQWRFSWRRPITETKLRTRRSSQQRNSNTPSLWPLRAVNRLLLAPSPQISCLPSPRSEGAKNLSLISKTWSCSLPMQVLIGSNNHLRTHHQMTVLLKEKLKSVPLLLKRRNNLHLNSLMQEQLRISNHNWILAKRASIVSSWLNSFIAPFPRLMMSTLTMRTSKRLLPATPKLLPASSLAFKPPTTRSNSLTCHRRILGSNMIKIFSKRVSNLS